LTKKSHQTLKRLASRCYITL